MFRWLIFITATGLLIASSTTSAAAADRDVVTVRLRARAKLTGADVTVADIASLEGGPALMRHQIGSLDIATIEEAATGAEISRRRVFFRIRLAGVAQQAFRLVGADSCRLEKQASQFMDEQIIDAIVKELANKWSLPADQILVRLTAPLREPIPAEHRGEPTELRDYPAAILPWKPTDQDWRLPARKLAEHAPGRISRSCPSPRGDRRPTGRTWSARYGNRRDHPC